jgi:glycosyltransferase involved in cell wall biosynthesis
MTKTKIVLITDAWFPQVNGVVMTYKNITEHLPDSHSVELIEPSMFKCWAAPFYPEIQLARCSKKAMQNLIDHAIETNQSVRFHIATEGPLGLKAKQVLDSMGVGYTTAYHTKFPEFLRKILGVPEFCTRWYFTWFHSRSRVVMASSESNRRELGYPHARVLSKGVAKYFQLNLKRSEQVKTLLFVGRVSREKNIDDFCRISLGDIATRLIVVGDGPDLPRLKSQYPNVEFVGYKFGEELASYYQLADVFVFPSTTDTFGMVILEAMACGTPVAAYPVTGAVDQIHNGINGHMNWDLEQAVKNCLNLDRSLVTESVKQASWQHSAETFVKYLA